jgi:hypothetical protein
MRYMKCCGGVLVVALAACGGTNLPLSGSPPMSAVRQNVSVSPQWRVNLFVRGNKKRYNPDPIVSQGNFFYVAFQNASQPDGTGGDSTIAQYKRDGMLVQTINVPGRCDGMRWNPNTNIMWLTVNEDANSAMYTWDPKSDALTHYSFSTAKHGGGYDDLAFSNGMAFIAASNPTLNARGNNKGPALVGVVLRGSKAIVKTVLKGNATATDIPTGNTVTLNLTDPDSLSITPSGDVLLVSQADSEIVFVHNAGLASQTVSRLLVGTQLDDTVYATKRAGLFYLADSKKDAIYLIRGPIKAGTLYTETPGDSGVAGFVGTVDTPTGTITPIITGFKSPTGLTFVAK